MSGNFNKKEKKDSISSKLNEIKKEEREIKNKNEKEIDINKQIFFKKIYSPFYKKKINKISNKSQNILKTKNNLSFRNYKTYNEYFTTNNIHSNRNLSENNIYINDFNNINEDSEKINLKNINEELLYNLELCENENIELKNVILELNTELIEKEKYLEKSENMILKLKENYLNLSKEYEKKELDYQNNILKNEDDILRESERKKNEIQKYINENNELKTKIKNIKNEFDKKVKSLKDITFSFQELKKKSSNFIEMLKDRERIIEENENKIRELNKEVNAKNEQLKLLMKYKNDKNPEKPHKNMNKNFMLDKDNIYKINIFPIDEQFNIDILEKKIFNNKISFKLQDALKDILYIPSNANMSISKEYLVDMNFKTELIKIECFSNYLREFNYIDFLGFYSSTINNFSFKDIIDKVYLLKGGYERLKYDIEKYINENNILKRRIKDLYLYIFKIKKELYNENNNFKLKLNYLLTLYENKMKQNNNINNNINLNETNNNINDSKYNYSSEHTNSFYVESKNKNVELLNDTLNKTNIVYITNKNDNDNIGTLTFKVKEPLNKITNNLNTNLNNNTSLNEYSSSSQGKKLEYDKLKSEIERLKNEIAVLIKDINDQQKLLSEIKNYKNKNEEYKINAQKKIKNFYSQIPKNTYNNIKSIIIHSSFDENSKKIINNIFNFFESFINDFNNINNNINNINETNLKSDNSNYAFKIDYKVLNKNIFSSSEYMKYLLIYEFTNINEIINVFYFIVKNCKQNMDKIILNRDSLLSQSLSDINININMNEKEEIIKIKNENIINESLVEIIKNYLVVLEKIKKISNDKNYQDNFNKINDIFIEGLCYRIDDLPDKDVFIRKLIIKLLENRQFH